MSESAIQIGKEEFEALLQGLGKAVERFVKYKISPVEDAEDILQEIYLTAYRKRDQLKNSEAFRPWILSIARNKCNDYYQQKAGYFAWDREKQIIYGKTEIQRELSSGAV